jgi:hypothetical protein
MLRGKPRAWWSPLPLAGRGRGWGSKGSTMDVGFLSEALSLPWRVVETPTPSPSRKGEGNPAVRVARSAPRGEHDVG